MAAQADVANNLATKVALASERHGDLPLCGHLIWYTVSDMAVTRQQLQEHFRNSGMDEQWLPPELRPVDAYRKATGQLVRTVPTPSEEAKRTGVVERRYRFEDVLCDSKRVIRHLVRVDVDARAVELRLVELAAVTFDRQTAGLQVQVLDATDPVCGELLDEAISRFKHYRDHYDGDAVRRMLHRILSSMDPTLFKDSGGFWFVPYKYASNLATFRRLLEALGLRYGTMPVVDTEDARNLVRQMFEHQAREIMGRLATLLKRDVEDLDRRSVVDGLDQAKDLLRQIREYQELLQQDLQDLLFQADVIQRQMLALVERVTA